MASGLVVVLAVVLVVRLVPRLLLGEGSFVTIHDNLDSDFVYRILINAPGRLFDGSSIVTEMVGGTPRWTYPSGFKFSSILFGIFPPFWAYVVLESWVSAMAATGMWLLLRDYLPSGTWARGFVATAFGLLPYYVIYDLSVAGQALVAWALLNLFQQRRVTTSLLVCAFFPFFSVLHTSGAFIVVLGGVGVLGAALWQRRHWSDRGTALALAGLVAMGVVYVLADLSFFKHQIFGGFVSHRSVWVPRRARPRDHDLFVFGDSRDHALSLNAPILACAVVVTLGLLLRRERRAAMQVAAMVGLCWVLAATVEGGWLMTKIAKSVRFMSQIRPRFWWSLPTAWFATLGMVVHQWPRLRVSPRWLLLFLSLNCLWVFREPYAPMELWKNYQGLAARALGRRPSFYSYRQFVAADAFREMRERIRPKKGERFLAIGFHPSVLAMNGFECADGYRNNYPLSYKIRFRRLIAGELAHNRGSEAYFDSFGSRLYVFLRSGRSLTRNPEGARGKLKELDLNPSALEDLGVRWIVSRYVLTGNALAPFLKPSGTFKSHVPGGPTFYLYRVDTSKGPQS